MQNDAPTDGEERGHEYREASSVVHGRVNLNPVTLPQLPRDNCVVGVPCNLPVRNHHALRPPGRPAGVEHAENIFGLDPRWERIWMHPSYTFGITQCLRAALLRIQSDGVLEGHELLELFRECLVAGGVHETTRSTVRKYLVQFMGRAARSERDEDDPRLARCPKGIDILDPVFG